LDRKKLKIDRVFKYGTVFSKTETKIKYISNQIGDSYYTLLRKAKMKLDNGIILEGNALLNY
jgi:hypothetical protein